MPGRVLSAALRLPLPDDDEYEMPSVAKDVPVSKLEEEEEEEAKPVRARAPRALPLRRLRRLLPVLTRAAPARRAQKAAAKKAAGDKKPKAKAAGGADEGVLADPLAEKLRQQRLQEAADLEHARAAFGDASKNLDDLLPRTEAVRAHARRTPPPAAARALRTHARALTPVRPRARRTSRSSGSSSTTSTSAATRRTRTSRLGSRRSCAPPQQRCRRTSSRRVAPPPCM
jgi:hypothetical protein